jgi:hypothetical protein
MVDGEPFWLMLGKADTEGRSTSLLERTVPSGTFVLGWTTHGAQGALVEPRIRIHLTEPMHSLLDRHMIVSSRFIQEAELLKVVVQGVPCRLGPAVR